MYGCKCTLLFALTLFCGINCLRDSKNNEEQCLDYYKTGKIFDLTSLEGQMYAVYYWPPNQRTRDSCEVITFRKLVFDEISRLYNECNTLNLSSEQVVMKATYVNNADKLTNLLYYGSDEVKNMYRSCTKNISRYLFIRVTDNYILGINCSAAGRGILLSRRLPSREEVEQVINEKDIMSGREGSPDCPLVENECGEIPTIIVQNKIDLMDQCVVGPDEAELVARALGCRLMRASVKEDVNVGAVFRALAARCLSDMRREDAVDSAVPPSITPLIGSFTNHNSNGTILLRPAKHRSGGKKKNVLKNACRLL